MKVWVGLQRMGTRGVGQLYEHLHELTRMLYSCLLSASRERLPVHEPESNIQCWKPGPLRRSGAGLRSALSIASGVWLTESRLNGDPVLRVTIMNPRTTEIEIKKAVGALTTAGAIDS